MALQKVGYDGSWVFEVANTSNPRTVLEAHGPRARRARFGELRRHELRHLNLSPAHRSGAQPPTMHSYIKDIGSHVGETVTIKGWLHNRRSSGKIHFLMVRDGTGFMQVVMGKNDVPPKSFQQADHLSQESAIAVTGLVRADARARAASS